MTMTVDQLTAVHNQLKAHGITKEFKITQQTRSIVTILTFVERSKKHVFKYSYDGHKIAHSCSKQ